MLRANLSPEGVIVVRNNTTRRKTLWAILAAWALVLTGLTAGALPSSANQDQAVTYQVDWLGSLCEGSIVRYLDVSPEPGDGVTAEVYLAESASGAGDIGTLVPSQNTHWLQSDGAGWLAKQAVFDTFGDDEGGPWLVTIVIEVGGVQYTTNSEWINFDCASQGGAIPSEAAWDDVSCDASEVTGRIVPPVLADDLTITVDGETNIVSTSYLPVSGEFGLDRQGLFEQAADGSTTVSLSRTSTGQLLGTHVYTAGELDCPVVNQPPTLYTEVLELDLSKVSSVEFTLDASDPEGDVLSGWSIVEQPTSGTIDQVDDQNMFTYNAGERGYFVAVSSVGDGVNTAVTGLVELHVSQTVLVEDPTFDPETGMLTVPTTNDVVYHVNGDPHQGEFQVCGSAIVEAFKASPDPYLILEGNTSWPVFEHECEDQPEPPVGPSIERWAGADRYATSVVVALEGDVTKGGTVFVASGQDYPDALAASASAGTSVSLAPASAGVSLVQSDQPVLLTRPDGLPASVQGALSTLEPALAYVIGGESVVGDHVVSQLEAQGVTVERLAGANRYATAVAVADEFHANPDVVLLATGQNFPDALSASALGGHLSAPVLLVKSDGLPDSVRDYLERTQPSQLMVVGGGDVVSHEVAQAAAAVAGLNDYSRLSGSDRYGTAAAVLDQFDGPVDQFFVASGEDYPDALTAGASGDPLVLTRQGSLPTVSADAITGLTTTNLDRAVVVGGPVAVSEVVFDETGQLIGVTAE